MDRKIKLVVADIDGTIQTTGTPMSEKNLWAIEELHRRGYLFGLASGKNLFDISRFAKRWGISYDFDVNIGMNGCEVWDNIHQKRHDYYKLKPQDIREIIEFMKPFDLNPFIYYKDGMKMMHIDEASLGSSTRNLMKLYVAKDISEFWEKPNAKVLFRTPEELMPELEAYIAAHPHPNFKGVKTQTVMMEFMNPKISKYYGLKKFCELNDISVKEVIAFGDTSNDNEMLKHCYGVCLCNGSEDSKAIADEVTELDCAHDGFADWLEKNLF